MLVSLWHCKEWGAEGEEKDKAAWSQEALVRKQMRRAFFVFETENKTGATPPLCEARRRIFCISPLVADAWFYFIFKITFEQTARSHSSRALAPWIRFSVQCPHSEVWVSHKHVLWIPLSLALHIHCTYLWEEIICPHQKQLLHHPPHISTFTQRENLIQIPFDLPQNMSLTLQIHILPVPTHQWAENLPPLADVQPNALCLHLDGSLETCGTFCAVRKKKIVQKRLLEQQHFLLAWHKSEELRILGRRILGMERPSWACLSLARCWTVGSSFEPCSIPSSRSGGDKLLW